MAENAGDRFDKAFARFTAVVDHLDVGDAERSWEPELEAVRDKALAEMLEAAKEYVAS